MIEAPKRRDQPERGTCLPKVHRLSDLAAGHLAEVHDLSGGSDFRSRMASLGFTPGATVRMLQNYGHGPVIVSLRGSRVALGRGEAHKVGITYQPDQSQAGY